MLELMFVIVGVLMMVAFGCVIYIQVDLHRMFKEQDDMYKEMSKLIDENLRLEGRIK